jgi:hypothetical protein
MTEIRADKKDDPPGAYVTAISILCSAISVLIGVPLWIIGSVWDAPATGKLGLTCVLIGAFVFCVGVFAYFALYKDERK